MDHTITIQLHSNANPLTSKQYKSQCRSQKEARKVGNLFYGGGALALIGIAGAILSLVYADQLDQLVDHQVSLSQICGWGSIGLSLLGSAFIFRDVYRSRQVDFPFGIKVQDEDSALQLQANEFMLIRRADGTLQLAVCLPKRIADCIRASAALKNLSIKEVKPKKIQRPKPKPVERLSTNGIQEIDDDMDNLHFSTEEAVREKKKKEDERIDLLNAAADDRDEDLFGDGLFLHEAQSAKAPEPAQAPGCVDISVIEYDSREDGEAQNEEPKRERVELQSLLPTYIITPLESAKEETVVVFFGDITLQDIIYLSQNQILKYKFVEDTTKNSVAYTNEVLTNTTTDDSFLREFGDGTSFEPPKFSMDELYGHSPS